MRNLPPAVKNIIIINALIMVMITLKESFMLENFALYFPASPFFRIWQPLTYMFMHGGFGHLFFNMYSLFIFGSVLERVWGTKKFLLFYLVTGLGAALVHVGIQWIQYSSALTTFGLSFSDASALAQEVARSIQAGADRIPVWSLSLFTPTVGASGAIYGVLMGYAMLYPDSILTLLFPPVSLKAKWFVLIFAAIELALGVFGTRAGIAHFAHLGGLIFGFILIMYWKRRHTLYSRYD
ncbi:MAG: rhomboid family intramembrane serine protease [Bacteroidales bacterium]|nr:rhomboid family intramembrane serine protease [Bacteroidales bacterium]